MADHKQPKYGQRLPGVMVDHLAKIKPNGIFASYAKSVDFAQGFRDVTWRDFANAVNRVAIWLETTLGGKSTKFETVAYIGDGDLRYFVLILASHKTGHKILLLSPRNSLEGQLNLIDKTSCHVFLRSDSVSVDEILSLRSLRSFVVPSLEDVLDPTPVRHVPYQRTIEQAITDPYVVYHSSGSTGLPKPIVSPQGTACTVDANNALPPLSGKESFLPFLAKSCPRFFSGLPFFHSAGVVFGMLLPIFFGNTLVIGSPSRPMSPDVVDQIIDYGGIDGMFLPPSILEEMSKNESSLERLSRLNLILVGGGPLATAAGKLVSQKTFLTIGGGSTEAHFLSAHAPDPEDWQYFMLAEKAAGMEMQRTQDQNLCELVFVRRPECEHLQGIFHTFRDLQEYRTGDLYEPHPSKQHLWRSVGRRDDMLVLSNGEKVQPGLIQDTLCGHKAVRDALIVGHGKFQIAAILELRSYPQNEEEARGLMDDIWPTIEEANRKSPAHGRLIKPFVLFASPDKPFIRVGKGSMSKPPTLKLYADEIEALYARGESGLAVDIDPLETNSEVALQSALCSVWEQVCGKRLSSQDDDFFSAGADSLAVLTLAATLKKSLVALTPTQAEKINPRLIYTHSTVRQLSFAILAITQGQHAAAPDGDLETDGVVKDLVSRIISTATLDMEPKSKQISHTTSVLLTGSTGSLGSYVLDCLHTNVSISKVYCLNRTDNGASKQKRVSAARGLPTDFRKVTFIKGDLSKENFDLDTSVYHALANEVQYIIHAQWPIDFNLGFTTFEPQIQGVANLASFASCSSLRPSICFLSSIGSVQNWNNEHSPVTLVPEQSLSSSSLATSGYGLSKLASSMILDHAASKGVRSLTLRIGQIAGPVNRGTDGIWPKQEWLPSLIASSKFLGVLPESLGGAEVVDWIPVDHVAQAVCEMAAETAAAAVAAETTTSKVTMDASSYAHIVSPTSTTWTDTILPVIQEYYQGKMIVVPLTDWVTRLKQSATHITAADMPYNPAIKLVDFYESLAQGNSLPRLATDRAQALSQTMRECKPVTKENVHHWLTAWEF